MSEEKQYIKDTLRVFVVPVTVLEDSRLSANEKLVYMVLRSFANAHKNEVWPSHSKIATLSSLSKSTVIRVIDSLMEKGFITKESKYDFDPVTKKVAQRSNLYKLELPGVTQTPPPVSHRHPPSVTVTPPPVSQ